MAGIICIRAFNHAGIGIVTSNSCSIGLEDPDLAGIKLAIAIGITADIARRNTGHIVTHRDIAQRRITDTRAVFGNPSLVVLDEPSSNLDKDGETALLSCLAELKRRKVSVVIVSHQASTLDAVDKLLILKDGAVEFFGLRNDFLAQSQKTARILRSVPTPSAI
jgi:ABC-type cobalamin/Fe3+-siderophores transport system ATPase subunit